MSEKPTYEELEQRVWELEQAELERRPAEEKLHETAEMLRNILTASSVGLAYAVDRKITWANDAMVGMFRFTDEDQYLGKDSAFLYADSKEYERVGRIIYEMQQASKLIEFDARFRRHDGSFFHGFARVNLLDSANPAKGIIVSIIDITERKRAEDAFQQSEQRYRTLVEESFDGIFVQKGSKIVFTNQRLNELLGYEDGELLGLDHWLLYHPYDQELTQTRAQARLQGEKNGIPI